MDGSKEAMSTKIGHFEILSELAKSSSSAVYKATDPESGQTIVLKAIQLSAFGEKASDLEQALLAEAESSKVLSSSNITKIYGAGEIEGQFCAAMEYVQGNSIATMLARKEGFSIWDLLDIGRQLCGGLDHAASNQIAHYSLEPAKIMCGWDGTVKILSFGVSSVGNFVQHASGGLSPILHYMSPEQIRGEATDGRSNLFSLGAMFYEMVTERKAFDRDDVEALRQSILESTPVAPIHVSPKVHPLLSDLIMKALAKDPAQRFQNGRELLESLERCKESKPAASARKPEAPKGLVAPNSGRAGAQSKFVGARAPQPAAAKAPPAAPAAATPAAATARLSDSASSPSHPAALQKPSSLAAPKVAAAAAGIGAGEPIVSSRASSSAESSEVQEIDLSDPLAGSPDPMGVAEKPSVRMSAAVEDESQVETFEPQPDPASNFAVDPMMAENGPAAGTSTSFSEISEMPPLKEVYIAPPPPPAPEPVKAVEVPAPSPTMYRGARKDEKPKVQPREVAEKAIKEIKGVPPKLMAYAIGGAIVLIVAIGIGVTVYVHQTSDDDAGAPRATAPADTPAPEAAPPAPAPEQAKAPEPTPAPAAAEPVEAPVQQESEPPQRVPSPKSHAGKKKAAVVPVVVPGQLAVDSTPQGALVQIDGASDPSWVTPFVITNMQPGQHSITTSKSGYVTDTRTINVASSYRASASIRLSQLMATLLVKSDPPGASVYVDSRDTGVKTPAQISLDKGQHFVLVRMSGYLDETMSQQFVVGQTFNFTPTLRALGNVDNIKTVNKISKLFGGGKAAQNGQATVTIHTQPRGAQIAVNRHMLDKTSPVDVLLDPGNYEVDITLSGYAPVHKVVTANRGEKVVIDEVLQAQ
jgi:eukaryotic-like serine/threonine-protein kinase